MTGLGEIIEGYGELAEWFVGACNAEARSTATRIDAGTFDADAAASAAVRAVNLGLLGLAGLAGSVVGASGVAKAPSTLTPLQCHDDPVNETRRFEHVTLTNDFGMSFVAHAVPGELKPKETDFRLVPDMPGFPSAGFYTGDLTVRADSGERKIPIEWPVG